MFVSIVVTVTDSSSFTNIVRCRRPAPNLSRPFRELSDLFLNAAIDNCPLFFTKF